jgi:hypothetical protein
MQTGALQRKASLALAKAICEAGTRLDFAKKGSLCHAEKRDH